VAALEALEVMRKEGLSGSAFIRVHANVDMDRRLHVRAAGSGAWVEFYGIGPREVDRHVDLVRSMKQAGRLGRVLLSHDAGWYRVGEPGGGAFRPYDTLMGEFVRALRAAGLSEAKLHQLILENPRDAFSVRLRPGC
jgi:phosphotriesterase-related protein